MKIYKLKLKILIIIACVMVAGSSCGQPKPSGEKSEHTSINRNENLSVVSDVAQTVENSPESKNELQQSENSNQEVTVQQLTVQENNQNNEAILSQDIKKNIQTDYSDFSFLKIYPAFKNADLISEGISRAPETKIFGRTENNISESDVNQLSWCVLRYINLTDNTADRNTYEISSWAFQTTEICWQLIDSWGKKSSVIGVKVCDVIFSSASEAQVNVLLYVNDNFVSSNTSGSYISGYSGEISNVSGFIAQFKFEKRENGWYMCNEAYPNFNINEQYVARDGDSMVTIKSK